MHLCIFALVFFSGCQSPDNIGPGQKGFQKNSHKTPAITGVAILKSITEWHEAVGTVRPMVETNIQAQVTGQVIDVVVKSGSKVNKGDLLVVLDSRLLQSKREQARQALKGARSKEKQVMQGIASAEAAFRESRSTYERTQKYHALKAATKVELERANALLLQSKAELKRFKEALAETKAGLTQAGEMVKEAEIGLGYTNIFSPGTGEILHRLAEPGDLAMPGKLLLVLQTSDSLLLEAYLREGLISKVHVGDELQVTIDALNIDIISRVEEIVPYADPSTRTFLVKVSLPKVQGLYPGMYGKLRIANQQQEIVLVPSKSIRKVGQLELVMVKVGERWARRMVKTGKTFGELIEVLSGLQGSEIIGWENMDND